MLYAHCFMWYQKVLLKKQNKTSDGVVKGTALRGFEVVHQALCLKGRKKKKSPLLTHD